MAVEKGDFIELEYTGRLESDEVFDTTSEEVAQEEGIYNEQADYGPAKIVVGEGYVVPGLDEALEGQEVGEPFNVTVKPEDGFGKKSTDKLQMIPMKEFKKKQIKPYVGLQVNIDNQRGTIRSVSGGRVIVDFNHPLASKELHYQAKIKRKIEDSQEQVESVMDIMGLPYESVETEEGNATIELNNKLPDQAKDKLKEEIEKLTDLDIELDEPEGEEEPQEKTAQPGNVQAGQKQSQEEES